MIVAAKTDQVEEITAAVKGAGFTPELVDVAPIALTNALKASGGGDECSVILDIGAKTTSLVIVDGEKLYNRSIPVAGNMITKDIASAFGVSHDEAEQLKRENAYVALGGVVEDEDETRDRISKVCRAVMTRLHAEISRSINFYRSQQGGGMPVKLYLTGGTALLPQVDRFFAENLQRGGGRVPRGDRGHRAARGGARSVRHQPPPAVAREGARGRREDSVRGGRRGLASPSTSSRRRS